MPDFRDYAVKVPNPGATTAESARELGKFLRDIHDAEHGREDFRLFSPDENNSNRWQDVLDVNPRAATWPTSIRKTTSSARMAA